MKRAVLWHGLTDGVGLCVSYVQEWQVWLSAIPHGGVDMWLLGWPYARLVLACVVV